MCGEQVGKNVGPYSILGSPPRVRGTASVGIFAARRHRITPACAGNSPRDRCSNGSRWDHPRVCGEQSSCPLKAARCRGSPPRVRGTAGRHTLEFRGVRITPACAGNSQKFHGRSDAPRDHPRVCGEQRSSFWTVRNIVGSPPRVRGTEGFMGLWVKPSRITPACAGNRTPCEKSHDFSQDHPRVCGEQ